MARVLMGEYFLWDAPNQIGSNKYARLFLNHHHDVFWVSYYAHLPRLLRRGGYQRARPYFEAWRRGVIQPQAQLHAYTPFTLLPFVRSPILDSILVSRWSLKLTLPSLAHVLRSKGFDEVDILWPSHVAYASLMDLVEHKQLVYRMADDIRAFGQSPRSADKVEQDVLCQADVVFATAHRLVQRAQQFAKRVYYLPNGVDFEHFCPPDGPGPEPSDLKGIPPPRVLYVGLIAGWFDFDLVDRVSHHLRDYQFVIIGPMEEFTPDVTARAERLKSRPNVHFLGPRPYRDIPAYVHHSDVGVIPFVPNPLTHAVNPIKLFEYAAGGLPVVAANLEEISLVGSPAFLYIDDEHAAELIGFCARNKQGLTGRFVEFGRENAWDRRYETVREALSL